MEQRERDISGDVAIVADAFEQDGPPNKEAKRAIVRLVAGFIMDFHRIANSMEAIARNSKPGKG